MADTAGNKKIKALGYFGIKKYYKLKDTPKYKAAEEIRKLFENGYWLDKVVRVLKVSFYIVFPPFGLYKLAKYLRRASVYKLPDDKYKECQNKKYKSQDNAYLKYEGRDSSLDDMHIGEYFDDNDLKLSRNESLFEKFSNAKDRSDELSKTTEDDFDFRPNRRLNIDDNVIG